jgi:hypothetical protein
MHGSGRPQSEAALLSKRRTAGYSQFEFLGGEPFSCQHAEAERGTKGMKFFRGDSFCVRRQISLLSERKQIELRLFRALAK